MTKPTVQGDITTKSHFIDALNTKKFLFKQNEKISV